MAAPTGQIKASRYFAALAVLLAVLYALVFFTGDKKPTPKLGLDLQGGTSMTLSAVGGTPSRERLDLARQIIADRVDLTGVSEPSVVVDGDRNIVVQVAGLTDSDTLRKLVAPAQLRFRQVLGQTNDTSGDTGSASPSPTPSASGSASPSGSTSPSASKASASASASASAKASASASASPSASASTSGNAAQDQLRAEVIKKLGVEYQIAQAAQSASDLQGQEASLQGFTKLSPDEVGALPSDIQFKVPTISCRMLDNRPIGSVNDPNQQVVACGTETGGRVKYLLDKARVVGEDIGGASFYNDPTKGWAVGIQFKSSGQDKWTKLTKDVYNNGATADTDPKRKVAIVLDNTVVSAPVIQEVITGDAQITGTFTKTDVETLSRQLKYGSLPLAFNIESVDTVSATIGLDALRAGLLAGAIGLFLVIVYCIVYYRALGLVVILSLVVSAALVYASLVLLGRGISYSLGLAGVAGFIVAIGITADSFVVFFERLKDEVKDGRTVRSAVPRAWVRARRTILSADTVSLLAAVVLYVLAVGGVKGFAFTLGMSTIIDLVVVFLFTHPLVAALSRVNTFTSPRFSGLGTLRPDKAATPSPVRAGVLRTKES